MAEVEAQKAIVEQKTTVQAERAVTSRLISALNVKNKAAIEKIKADNEHVMNVPFYLEFLVWRMRCGHDGGILERNLFMMLRSVEVISFLRVLAILHISVCMPMRWLAGNCGDLAQYNFGVAEMASVVDIMDKAFGIIVHDGSKIMNEQFMMSMFKKLTRKIPPCE